MTPVTCVNEKCQTTFDSGLEHSVDGDRYIVVCPSCATRQLVKPLQIEADRNLALKKATRGRGPGIKFVKLTPPGTV